MSAVNQRHVKNLLVMTQLASGVSENSSGHFLRFLHTTANDDVVWQPTAFRCIANYYVKTLMTDLARRKPSGPQAKVGQAQNLKSQL